MSKLHLRNSKRYSCIYWMNNFLIKYKVSDRMAETLKTENKMEKEIKEEIREEVKQKLLPTSTEDIEISYTKGIFLRKSFVPSLISRQVRISLSKKKQQNVL